MGFCFFNNVAVAAQHAVSALGLERVAIVDIDIHHGNGTQDAFYTDPSVLYISTHQYPYYPGTGHWREAGSGEGIGTTVNLSLPGGCGDAEYGLAMEEVIAPKLRAYRPELILVSAGYDAHHADPIDGAMMRLSCAGYAGLIGRLQELAVELCAGKIVVALEGGYDLTALSWSIRNSIEALLGDADYSGPYRTRAGNRSAGHRRADHQCPATAWTSLRLFCAHHALEAVGAVRAVAERLVVGATAAAESEAALAANDLTFGVDQLHRADHAVRAIVVRRNRRLLVGLRHMNLQN